MNNEREFRSFAQIVQRDADDLEENKKYLVEGYASTFEPYTLWTTEDGVEIKEQIEPDAFAETDFSDVVFRIDHEGPVFARTSNGLVSLNVDEHGLKTRIDLSKTEKARGIFEDIEAGMYPQMSFAFTVEREAWDRETHTRHVEKIGKLYDVSAVSFPANPGTEIGVSLRDRINGEIEAETAERLEAERQRLILQLRLKHF